MKTHLIWLLVAIAALIGGTQFAKKEVLVVEKPVEVVHEVPKNVTKSVEQKGKAETSAESSPFISQGQSASRLSGNERYSKEHWINAGQATPTATYQTALWALNSGNVEALRVTIAVLEDDRAKMEELFESLPENVRSRYLGLDEFMATLFASGPIPDEFQVLSESDGNANTVVQRVRLKDAGGSSEISITYQWSPDGWRMTIPSGMVAGAIRMITGKARPSIPNK